MQLFLDANILFSAAWREDAAAQLLWDLSRSGRCQLLSSGLAVEEARRNITRKRPDRSRTLESLVVEVTLGLEPTEQHLKAAQDQQLPSKDVPLLAAAVAQQAEILVTGDRRDFGHLHHRSVSGLSVLPLADAVECVLESEGGHCEMNHPVLTLDAGDVDMAMSDQTMEWLLDPVTGKLCMDPEEVAIHFGREEVETWAPTDPEQVLPIPHFSSSDGYRLMLEFTLKHAGPEASQRLQQALDQRKPFRRFKDALGEFPEDRQRWFEFEEEEKKRIAEEFYEDEGYAVRWTESPGDPTGLL